MSRLASGVGLALVAGSSAAYLAYTLGGVDGLAPFLLRRRGATLRLGLALTGLGVLLAPRRPSGWAAALVAAGLATYATRRQWLSGHPARAYTPELLEGPPAPPGPDGWVVALPDGGAVRLRAAAQDRVLFAGQWLVVHCGLARSVAVFEAPRVPVAAVLPHRSGFFMRVGEALLDGVDGRAAEGGEGLSPVAVRVLRLHEWREQGGTRLYERPARGQYRARTPRVPGARGVRDPMRIGRVEGGVWVALPPSGAEAAGAVLHLARWAARARGLSGTET